MPIDKLDVWSDSRIQRRSAFLNGRTYGYLYGEPQGTLKGTLFLIHGFPDISMGWRYQIPMFLQMGLRVVAPDCMGYGRTDAPPYTLKDYGYRRVSDDIAELARQLGCKQIILGGHDWGGAIVYRAAQYHPTLITHLFSICTPYFPPSPVYEPLHLLVSDRLPNFGYQEHFASGELEEQLQSRTEIKSFLNGMYGARGSGGEVAFDATKGVFLENLPKLRMTPLLSERELEYYAQEYARHGLHGPLNWYRNREVNFVEELEWFWEGGKTEEEEEEEEGEKKNQKKKKKGQPRIEQEVLFVLATKDQALKPAMAAKMGERIEKLTRREVTAGHWALWERPAEVNGILREWFDGVVFGGKSRL